MSIVDNITVAVSTVDMQVVGNTGLSVSPLIDSAQYIDRGGLKWRTVLNFLNRRGDQRADMMALIVQLRGQANQVRVEVSDNPKRGAYGGTPLVAGGAQTGNTIDIDGCDQNVANWIRRGDYFSIQVGTEHELKMCMADASTDGTGAVTLTFEPRLRASPNDNAVIAVESVGAAFKPYGLFRAESPVNGWNSRPGKNSKVSNFTLPLIEDVFATQ